MVFKSLTVPDLKKDYMERHGFIFRGQRKCDSKYCDPVCDALIKDKVTTVRAEFVVKIDEQTYIFVYPEGISFDAPYFYSKATKMGQMLGGLYRVDTLTHFLQNN